MVTAAIEAPKISFETFAMISSPASGYFRVEDWITLPQIPSRFLEVSRTIDQQHREDRKSKAPNCDDRYFALPMIGNISAVRQINPSRDRRDKMRARTPLASSGGFALTGNPHLRRTAWWAREGYNNLEISTTYAANLI